MKTTHVLDAVKTLAVIVGLVAVFIIWPWLNQKAVANCNAINENRREAEVRARILQSFLRDAASARRDSAQMELKTEPKQAVIDLAAAARYDELANDIHNLPPRAC